MIHKLIEKELCMLLPAYEEELNALKEVTFTTSTRDNVLENILKKDIILQKYGLTYSHVVDRIIDLENAVSDIYILLRN